MTAQLPEFGPAKEAVSWAKDAIRDLGNAITGFFKDDCASVITEDYGHTGEKVQKLILNKPLPSEFSRRANEALTTTRHAFDQATFAAQVAVSGACKKGVNFPWANSPTDLAIMLEKRRISERLWGVFLAHEPYPGSDAYAGGNDLIRSLAALVNNKHTVGLYVHANIKYSRYPEIVGGGKGSLRILNMPPRWDSVENYAELVRYSGDVKVMGNYKFAFEVILKDPILPKPVHALNAMGIFAAKAEAVIKSLEARCLEFRR